MIIYTLQFPTLGKMSRLQFLTFTQRNVIEFAYDYQDEFLQKRLTSEFFHADASLQKRGSRERIPVLIHSIVWNGVYSLRAYGERAVETLRLWIHFFLDTHPQYTNHIIEQIEHVNIEEVKEPIIYRSTNWIAFRNMATEDGFYVDANKNYTNIQNEKDQPCFALNKQLFNNLGTFLSSIDVKAQRSVSLCAYPAPPDKLLALRTKVNGTMQDIYKQAFSVKIETNLSLPICFSLGQNVGYGNGLFVREI